jgi:hypothetical protein
MDHIPSYEKVDKGKEKQDDASLDGLTKHPARQRSTRFRPLSDGASSSSSTNPMDTSELGQSRHEDHSLLYVQDGQLLASGSTELHEPLESRLDHRPQSELEEEQHLLLEQHDLHQRRQRLQERQDRWLLCLPLSDFFQQWQQYQSGWQRFMLSMSQNLQRRLRQPVWAVECMLAYMLNEHRLMQESGTRQHLQRRLWELVPELLGRRNLVNSIISRGGNHQRWVGYYHPYDGFPWA